MNAAPAPAPRPPRVALVHPGTQHSHRLAEQLHRHGLLAEFWTGVAASDRGLLARFLRPGARNPLGRLFARRLVRGVPGDLLRLRPWPELLARWRERNGAEPQALWHARNAAFQQALPDRVFRGCDAVIGFDTSSWILALRCAAAGTPLVLDQSIGFAPARRALYAGVRRRFPEWRHELEERRPEVLAAEQTEHRLAARIVAASSFTRQTLAAHGVPSAKIAVNPYGVDLARFAPGAAAAGPRPFRFVFVGQVSARKGVPLLLEAWARLRRPGAELWLVGHVAPSTLPLVAGVPGVVLTGAVPHADLPALLRQCDVFVFPSYFEGFALVLLEALACGLPIVASDATAAPDLIADGVEGFVVPTGDGDTLARHLQWFLDQPARATAMAAAARGCAARHSWEAYGDRWARLIREVTSVPVPTARVAAPAGRG